MNLTKKIQVLVGLVAMAAVTSLAMFISPAPEAEAASCHPHVMNFGIWGSGSSCAAATSNLSSQGYAKANATCGNFGSTPCTVSVTPTNSCYVEGGMWKIDGTVTFQCENI